MLITDELSPMRLLFESSLNCRMLACALVSGAWSYFVATFRTECLTASSNMFLGIRTRPSPREPGSLSEELAEACDLSSWGLGRTPFSPRAAAAADPSAAASKQVHRHLGVNGVLQSRIVYCTSAEA